MKRPEPKFLMIVVITISVIALLAAAMPVGAQGDPSNVPFPGDNRLDARADAPVALYCNGSILDVWQIDSIGVGHFAFRVRPNEIRRVVNNNVNTLVKARRGIGVFRLTSGQLQVMVPTVVGDVPPPAAVVTNQNVSGTTTMSAGGQVIHVVQAGENLFRIGLRYNLPFTVVAAANGISNPDRIFAGQRLVIPVAGGVVTNPAPASPAQPAQQAAVSTTGNVIYAGFDYFFIFDGCGVRI